MRYAIVIEQAQDNYAAYVPDLLGCVATGKTAAEAEQQIREAIEIHLRGMREDGLPIPEPGSQAEHLQERMKTFISWSGTKSQEAAKALQSWLRVVIKDAAPWMSEEDIPAGRGFLSETTSALKQARFGVLCVTSDNLTNPWLIFEAGALFNNGIDVCPYIIDLDSGSRDLPDPLRHLQAKMANRNGTEQLVLAINRALGSPVDVDTLKKNVRSNWKKLEKKFEVIGRNPPPRPRTIRDYENLGQEFVEIFMDVNRHRTSLSFSGVVDDAIESFVAQKYNREMSFEQAHQAIKESRDTFDRRSILVGNVRDFLEEHFPPDDLRNIILRLEPILFSKSQPRVKRDMLMRRIKIEALEVFLGFHRKLVEKLRERLS